MDVHVVCTFSTWSLIVVRLAIQDTLLVNGVSVQGQIQKMGFCKSGRQHKTFTSHAFNGRIGQELI